jgi:hypothetical protein
MRFSWLTHFCAWLDHTALSQFIQGAGWIVPAVQTMHILAIAAVLGSQTMIAAISRRAASRRVSFPSSGGRC